MGATLMSEKVESVLGFGDHGSTFGGNPVCAAAALSVISRIDSNFLSQVEKKGAYIKEELEKTGAEVSGLGMMLGIKTDKPVSEIISECMEKGVLCLSAKDRVRLLPALNIPMELLRQAVEVIRECCA